MIRRILPLALVAIALGATLALAQAQGQKDLQIGVTRPQPTTPPPAPNIFEQRQPEGITGAQEQEYYPERIRARHDPAFLSPFTTTISTGPKTATRVGLSLWTSPIHSTVQREAGRESGGVLSFGFSLAWDVPQPENEAKPQAPASPR